MRLLRFSCILSVFSLCLLPCAAQDLGGGIERVDLFRVTDILSIPVDVNIDRPFVVRSVGDAAYIMGMQNVRRDSVFIFPLTPGAERIALPTNEAKGIDGTSKDFVIAGDTIVLLAFKALLTYDRTQNGYRLRNVLHLDVPYSSMKSTRRGLLLSVCYVGLPGASKTWAALVNAAADSVLWEHPLPEPCGVEFTYFVPRRVVDFSSEYIAVADIPAYAIHLYSLGSGDTVTLRRDIDSMNCIPSDHPIFGGVQAREEIDTLRSAAYGRPNIRLITFLNDSCLLVTVQHGEKVQRGLNARSYFVTHDIWAIQDGAWRLLHHDIPDPDQAGQDAWGVSRRMPLSNTYGFDNGNRLYNVINLTSRSLEASSLAEESAISERAALDGPIRSSIVRYAPFR